MWEGASVKEINFVDIPILSGLDRVNLARLIPTLEQVSIRSGEIIFRQGDPGDSLYIIIEGIVRVYLEPGGPSREIACLGPRDCFGEMALLTGEPCSADIQAMTDLTLLKLSKDRFDQLIKKHQSIGVNFAGLLASRLSFTYAVVNGRKEIDVAKREPLSPDSFKILSAAPAKKVQPISISRVFLNKVFLCLALVVILCTLLAFYLRTTSLIQPHRILIELLLAATVVWSFNITSFHAVSVALPVLAVMFATTTPQMALSGFSNPSWFLVLGVFAISAAISKTGLLYRLVLLLMKHFPSSYIGQTFGLAFSGLILTPVIPSSNGRVNLASPLVLTLSEILGFKAGSPGSIGMAMACLLGFGHMSFMFMNGTASCFLVLGLLPPEVSSTITWSNWLKITFPLGIFFFLSSYLTIILLYRPKKITELKPFVIEMQLKTLGPLTIHEKISLATVVISLTGFLTQSWHQINVAWVAMVSFLILFASSVLDEKAVRTDIDWNFLIAFGALVGFGNVISTSGLTTIISIGIKPYMEIFIGSKWIFLLAVAIGVHTLRIVLPLQPALLVSVLSIMPILSTLKINPFVVGLIALISGNPWFLPHQDTMQQNILQTTEGKLFNHEQTVKLAFIRALVILASVAISFVYWRWLGLIR